MSDLNENTESGSGKRTEPRIKPRDFNEIEAVDPWNGKKWPLYVRNNTVKLTGKKGIGATRELMFTVLEAVQKPTAVFLGIQDADHDGEDGDEDWLVYVALPARAYDHKTGELGPAWKGEVLLVFVDEDHVVRRWRWDDADQDNPKLPIDYNKGRFRERLL